MPWILVPQGAHVTLSSGNSWAAGNSHLSLHCSRNSDGFLLQAAGTLYLRTFFELYPQVGQNGGAEELVVLGLDFGQGWELVDENLSFFAS